MRWIVFGEDWGSHPSSTQHLFKRIAQEDEVIWINSMGLRSPKLSKHDFARAYRKGKAMLLSESSVVKSVEEKNSANQIQPKHLIDPKVIPFFGSQLVRQFNRYQLKKQIRALVKDDQPTVLWLSLPSAVDLIGHCGEDFSIYYCGDDFSSLAGVDHAVISQMETQLAERCDLILTASQRLAEKFPIGKTRVLEHGVDFQLFSQATEKPKDFPMGKVMGFYGQLADWVDIQLLKQISQQFPEWTLMLIGAVHTDTRDLLEQPNVLWLDAIPHQQLAAYCQHWDIALLPFRHCEQITHCNPLKLKEYLATGTEVVSLTFPAAEPYGELVHLADNAEHFLQLLNGLALSGSEAHSQASDKHLQNRENSSLRQQAVAPESWEHKTQVIRQLIRARSGFLASQCSDNADRVQAMTLESASIGVHRG